MSTEALYREDAYLRSCDATVTAVGEAGIELDKTVFYPLGGGQAGDQGVLRLADGREIAIVETRKSKRAGATPDDSVHVPATDADLTGVEPGLTVHAEIDWAYRHRLMRFHTATHLLCALVPHPVNGCSITGGYARLDFAMTEPLDKAQLQQGLEQLCQRAVETSTEWISDDQMKANPELVRTMSVQPPMGFGKVRLLRIPDIDLQPCGGTHVANLSEIAPMVIAKIEKKSAQSRRVTLKFE